MNQNQSVHQFRFALQRLAVAHAHASWAGDREILDQLLSSWQNVEWQRSGFCRFGNRSPGTTDRKPFGIQTLGAIGQTRLISLALARLAVTSCLSSLPPSAAFPGQLAAFFFGEISEVEGGDPAVVPGLGKITDSQSSHQSNPKSSMCFTRGRLGFFLIIFVSLLSDRDVQLTFGFLVRIVYKKEYKAQKNTKLVIGDECASARVTPPRLSALPILFVITCILSGSCSGFSTW